MPSTHPSPQAPAFQPAPMARPRRNSSVHEPSPLARLFVRSPGEAVADRLRDRRQSLVSDLAVSQSQPALSSILSPAKNRPKPLSHRINQSTSGLPSDPRQRHTHLARPSIVRIEEGKKLSFSSRNDSPSRSRDASPAKASLPFPRHGESEREGTIGKASDVQEMLAAEQPENEKLSDRLGRILARQNRIESLLEKLVAAQSGDTDVFDNT